MTSEGTKAGLHCYLFPLVMERLMVFAFQTRTMAPPVETQSRKCMWEVISKTISSASRVLGLAEQGLHSI